MKDMNHSTLLQVERIIINSVQSNIMGIDVSFYIKTKKLLYLE